MSFSPIEDLRLRLLRTTKRRGRGPAAAARLLDELLPEWYQAMPDAVISIHALQTGDLPKRDELIRSFRAAEAAGDQQQMASLLPPIMQMDHHDPERPGLLNCAANAAVQLSQLPVPKLVQVAFEEASATAPPFSRLHLAALVNLASCYHRSGRVRAAYRLNRELVRELPSFTEEAMTTPRVYYGLSAKARWLGKPRTTEQALRKCMEYPAYYERWRTAIDAGLFSVQVRRLTPLACKRTFHALYPDSPYQAHLLGSYAAALLRFDRPRASLRVAALALGRLQAEHPDSFIAQAEVLIVMAAASQQLGQDEIAASLAAQAQHLLGDAALYRPVTVRMQDWLALREKARR